MPENKSVFTAWPRCHQSGNQMYWNTYSVLAARYSCYKGNNSPDNENCIPQLWKRFWESSGMVYLPQISWTFESQVTSIEMKTKHASNLSWFHPGFWRGSRGLTWPTRSLKHQVSFLCVHHHNREMNVSWRLTWLEEGRGLVSEIPFCAQHLNFLDYFTSVDLSGLPPSSPAWHGLAHQQGLGFSSELLVFMSLWFTPGSHMAWLDAGVYFCQHTQIHQY